MAVEKKSGNREKILEAADSLFGELGYDATTTREIAERSAVNKALIHYHFKSKEGLLEALLDRYYGLLSETVTEALTGQGSLEERVFRLLDVYVDFLGEHRNFGRIVQREASGGRHVEQIQEHMVPLFRLGTEILEGVYPGTASGELAARQLLPSIYGMVISYFTYSGVLEHLMETDPLSEENLALRKAHLRRMVQIVLQAIEAEEAGVSGEN